MLALGWRPSFGGAFEFRYRTIRNESYSSVDYERGYDATIRYSRPLGQFTIGAEAFVGRDVFGEDFRESARSSAMRSTRATDPRMKPRSSRRMAPSSSSKRA